MQSNFFLRFDFAIVLRQGVIRLKLLRLKVFVPPAATILKHPEAMLFCTAF